MGWAGGSNVCSKIIRITKQVIKDEKVRAQLYVGIIDVLEAEDWDTQDECYGIDKVFDVVMKKRIGDDWE